LQQHLLASQPDMKEQQPPAGEDSTPATAAGAAQPAPLSEETPAEAAQRLRGALVDGLKTRGLIHSEALEQALRRVPRECFVPEIAQRDGLERVYSDEALITKRGPQGQPISSSSAPSMMAIMLEQLDLHPGLRVLEIGAGTGYNAAILAEMVGDQRAVVTIDIEPDVVESARQHLADAGYSDITVLCADGAEGAVDHAPFDRVELTVASDDITPAWIQQLHMGGRLVLPLELHRHQRGQISLALIKHEDYLESVAAASAFFIPLRGGQAMTAERSAPLSVVSKYDQEHHWELNLYGAPLTESTEVRRDVLHLLSGSHESRDLHLGGPARALLSYLELRYGEADVVYAWSGSAIWGFEGWVGGILAHPAREQSGGLAFPPFSGSFRQQIGLALLRPATNTPDDAGLDQAIIYGSSAALRQLQNLAREWKRLGHPDLAALRVRVYPQRAAPAPAADEWVISKSSVQLLLSFQQETPAP
jgi:methyltransferase of FxLD system